MNIAHQESERREYLILQSIHQEGPAVRQRDLSREIGLSLGIINAVLKRLAAKGWLQIRKVNNRNVQYIVSPSGVEELARRSYRYLRRTIKNVVGYKQSIEDLVRQAKQDGYSALVVLGRSDVDFIVEHFCRKHEIGFVAADDLKALEGARGPDRLLLVLSEEINPEPEKYDADHVFLRDVLT